MSSMVANLIVTSALLLWHLQCLSQGAGSPPSEIDLKAAYCGPVAKARLQLFQRTEPAAIATIEAALARADLPLEQRKELTESLPKFKRQIEDAQTDLNRLGAYLLPRIAYLDSEAIALAIARGTADVQTFDRRVGECGKSCIQGATSLCYEQCVGPDLMQRARQCWSPTWLPF